MTRGVDDATGEATLEPAHESLLRQWGGLRGWLEEDFGRLATLEGVKRAARDWDANARAEAWAAHGGARLEEADRLDARPDIAAMLDKTDRAYLAACRAKETAAREAEAARLRAEASSARNARRVAWVSTVGAIVALAFAGLAGWQWRLAVAAEREAAAQRDKAGKALALATKTADGLWFDLAQKFEHIGLPAKLRAEILGRARKLQEQLAQGGGEDNAALRRSRAATLGESVDSLLVTGDLAGAMAAARESAQIFEALSKAEPASTDHRRDLSVSYDNIGYVLSAQGDLAGALKSYKDSLAIREALSRADPGNAMWRRDLSLSYEKIGDVLRAQGDLAGALKSYKDSLAIAEALSRADPGNAEWRRDVLISYYKLAQADPANARAHLLKAKEIARELQGAGKLAPRDANIPAILDDALKALDAPAPQAPKPARKRGR